MITTVKEYEKDICQLFKSVKIEAYSTYDIQGHKLQAPVNIQDNWFSSNRDTFDSTMYFSFTHENQIDKMLNEVKIYNKDKAITNPVKAIVMDIEKHV